MAKISSNTGEQNMAEIVKGEYDDKMSCTQKRKLFVKYVNALGFKVNKEQIRLIRKWYPFVPSYKNRNCKELLGWRNSVFKRDNYTCQECSKVGGDLQAHHIVPYKIKKKRYDINNGKTLCVSCHKDTNTFMKKGN